MRIKSSLLIIGKNSQYYSEIKKNCSQNFIVKAISHNEINSTFEGYIPDLVLILSRIEKREFLEELSKSLSEKSKVILLSSIILNLPISFNKYSYYLEKNNVESWFLNIFYKKNSGYIIRSGNVTGKTKIIYTTPNDVVKILHEIDERDNDKNFFNTEIKINHEALKLPPVFYRRIFNLKYGYVFLRIFDLIIKRNFKNMIYGYDYALYKFYNQEKF